MLDDDDIEFTALWKAVTLGYDQERFQRFMNWAEAQCAIRL